jgi:hypothetical protein
MTQLTKLTLDEASDLFGVSARTINYAKATIRDGTPALSAAMESGLITVGGAHWLSRNASAAIQDWVVEGTNRIQISRRLRMVRIGVWPSGEPVGDTPPTVPVGVRVPQMRQVAIAAARAAGRATLPKGRPTPARRRAP